MGNDDKACLAFEPGLEKGFGFLPSSQGELIQRISMRFKGRLIE
jgi:hypothetical protein